MRTPHLLLALPSLFALGCAKNSTSSSWIARHGGLATGAELLRANALLQRLQSVTDVRLTVDVLSSPDLAAYSWSNGRLFITSGLAATLTDDELLAALAHEVGHLAPNADGSALHGLSGNVTRQAKRDVEALADAAGVQLLSRCGVAPTAMVAMLQKVATNEQPTSQTRHALDRRILRLQAHEASR